MEVSPWFLGITTAGLERHGPFFLMQIEKTAIPNDFSANF
jgi:hypothetical protein